MSLKRALSCHPPVHMKEYGVKEIRCFIFWCGLGSSAYCLWGGGPRPRRPCYSFWHLCDDFQSSPHWLTFIEPVAVCRASGSWEGSSLALVPALWSLLFADRGIAMQSSSLPAKLAATCKVLGVLQRLMLLLKLCQGCRPHGKRVELVVCRSLLPSDFFICYEANAVRRTPCLL